MGNRIQERLAELGKSQHWLAKQVGIKQPSVNAIIKKPESGSKHTLAIAQALGVSPEWLAQAIGPKLPGARAEALLVGKVGAGAEIIRTDEGTVLEGIEPPHGVGPCNAAIVSGDSMHPMQEGWIIFYGQEHDGVQEDAVGKLAIVQIQDGPTLLKTLKRGSKRGLWRLESWNAPPREDVKLTWATRVLGILPR